MSLEDRVNLLEQSLSTLNRVVSEQMLHGRDIDHNLTILLGTAKGQEHESRETREDISTIKEHVGHVEVRLDALSQQVDRQFSQIESRLNGIEKSMDTQLTAVNERLDAIVALLTGGQEP